MVTKPTGRPRGRPKGAPNKTTKKRIRLSRWRGARSGFATLTEEQILALVPREAFRLLLQHYVRVHDLDKIREVAKDWAPYEHARKTDQQPLTPEEIRQLGNLARSEASRRGYDLKDAPGPADGIMPN